MPMIKANAKITQKNTSKITKKNTNIHAGLKYTMVYKRRLSQCKHVLLLLLVEQLLQMRNPHGAAAGPETFFRGHL